MLLLFGFTLSSYSCEVPLTRSKDNSILAETKRQLRAKGNVYDPEPSDVNAPLEEEHVMNTYWRRIKESKDPKVKNDAFAQILNLHFTDDGYALERYHKAAAVLAGADPHVPLLLGTPLDDAAMRQDESLCRIFLQKGARPNEGYDWRQPPLFSCKSLHLAQLFLSYGADITVKDGIGDTYLHRIMGHHEYDVALIKYVRERGLSPFDVDSLNGTPLHSLAFSIEHHTQEKIQEKVDALFAGLSLSETQRLVLICQNYQGIVFDILDRIGSHYKNTWPELSARSKFLKDKLRALTINYLEQL